MPRTLSTLVFNYSLDGLMADPDTDFWKFCFGLLDEQGGPDDDEETIDLLSSSYAHIMGRTAYEGMSAMAGRTDPWANILNNGRKVVFSRTMRTADWAGTTIASGDTLEEIDKLRQGGDGHLMVWGGVDLWRSLMRLDLIDDWYFSLYPYITEKGTRLFDETVPADYRLDLVSSVAKSNGIVELHYRRPR
jgi:dihydrofolate reductase